MTKLFNTSLSKIICAWWKHLFKNHGVHKGLVHFFCKITKIIYHVAVKLLRSCVSWWFLIQSAVALGPDWNHVKDFWEAMVFSKWDVYIIEEKQNKEHSRTESKGGENWYFFYMNIGVLNNLAVSVSVRHKLREIHLLLVTFGKKSVWLLSRIWLIFAFPFIYSYTITVPI